MSSEAGSATSGAALGARPERPGSVAERVVAAVERRWQWALAALLLGDLALLLYVGRELGFHYDEWNWVIHDYGGGLHTLFVPHVGNISVFPVIAYKILFHLAGLNHHMYYRLVVVVLHLMACTLIFFLASPRIGRVPALLAMALILFLGAAWEDLLWAFQMGYMLSIVGGLAAFLLLERRDLRGDVAATAFLVLAAGSSSLGIAMIAGVFIELAWQRRLRRAWVVLVPAVLYAIWYLKYGESELTEASLINSPGYAADLAAAAFGALVGRALEWGRPLAVGGVALLLGRLIRPVPVTARLAGVIGAGVALWTVTALARSTTSGVESSRYTYLGSVVIVLIGVELLRGRDISARAIVVAAAMVLYFALTGVTVMHAGAAELRLKSTVVTAQLGALELAGAYAPPEYKPSPIYAPDITAGAYRHVVRAIGSSPADAPSQIAAAEPTPRAEADAILILLESPKLSAPTSSAPALLPTAPTVLASPGAVVTSAGGCVSLKPSPGAGMIGVLRLPPAGVLIHNAGAAPVGVAIKRFGEAFTPLAGAVPHGAAELTVAPDSSSILWQFQVSSTAPLRICSLAG
jgi:hypothetical protein